jgi:hypothetical protein
MPDDRAAGSEAGWKNSHARERAIQCLWQLERTAKPVREEYLYAILDAARDKRIYPGLQRLAAAEQILPLYQGQAAIEFAAAAPYLVCLGTSDRVFDWIWQEGWGETWGIFLWALVTPDVLRAHFRRLTVVRTEQGMQLLFRFYDPRVLQPFLGTCDVRQLHEMFGPVVQFAVDANRGRSIEILRLDADQLVTVSEPLDNIDLR